MLKTLERGSKFQWVQNINLEFGDAWMGGFNVEAFLDMPLEEVRKLSFDVCSL